MTTATPPAAHAVQVLSDGPAPQLQGDWPDRRYTTVPRAELHSYRAPGAARGQALICVGGGYLQLVHDKEGVEIAQWLNDLGLDGHVLVHRLPGQPDGHGSVWPFDIALADGLAALRHLATAQPRAELPLLLVGLSSGGHLAGVLACQHQAQRACGLLVAYAPLNANHRAHKAPAGKPDYPPPQKQAFYDAWPVGMPGEPHGQPPLPVFLAYALHDAAVPLDHALNVLRWAQQSGADVQAHVFPRAPHGFALRGLEDAQALWPALAAQWMHRVLQEAAQAHTPASTPAHPVHPTPTTHEGRGHDH